MLNFNAIAAKLTSSSITLTQALELVNGVTDLIDLVEVVYDGLKGKEKLALVKAAAKGLTDELGITDDFENVWKILGPLVNLLVALFNLKGLWKKIT